MPSDYDLPFCSTILLLHLEHIASPSPSVVAAKSYKVNDQQVCGGGWVVLKVVLNMQHGVFEVHVMTDFE